MLSHLTSLEITYCWSLVLIESNDPIIFKWNRAVGKPWYLHLGIFFKKRKEEKGEVRHNNIKGNAVCMTEGQES